MTDYNISVITKLCKQLFHLSYSLYLILLLAACSSVDNQKDIDPGSSNKIAQSPCHKVDIEPFYVNGIWINGHPLNNRS